MAWVVSAGALAALPPAGETQWTEGRVLPGVTWERTLRVERAGWLLCELDGTGRFADLDLEVTGAGWTIQANSHLPSERLLLPLLAGEELRFRVEAAAGFRLGAFRLGLSLLRADSPLLLEGGILGAVTSRSRVRLYRLRVWEPLAVAATLRRLAGLGELDLLLFDAHGPLAIGERVLPDTREGPLIGAADERTWARLSPGDELLAVVRTRGAPARFELRLERSHVRRSALTRFLDRLRAPMEPGARRVVDALRRNVDFLRIQTYLEGYPGGTPFQLRVRPGLQAHGIERFGTFSQRTLTINPTIAGHRENPQEMVDTVIHELIHALLALPREVGFPLGEDVLDASHDPRLEGFPRLPLQRGQVPPEIGRYLDHSYGPSASNPEHDYTDINAGAQRLVMKVVRETLGRTGVGRESLVFANARQRRSRASIK